MLRKIAISLGVLAVIAVGVLVYQKYIVVPDPTSIELLVAEEAVWVYHSDRFSEDWVSMKDSPLGDIIASIPDVALVKQGFSALDSTSLSFLLQNHPLYISCQIIGNDDIGFTFYLDLAGSKMSEAWQKLNLEVSNSPDWKIEKQYYQTVDITEWVYLPLQTRFSWIRNDNFLIGSFTPFLVEDQIRRLNNLEGSTGAWQKSLTQRSFSQRDQGDIVINGKQLSRFFSVFTSESESLARLITGSLAQYITLDLSIESGQWLFSGFSQANSNDRNSPSYYLATFDEQSSTSFGISNYLPSRTSAIKHWTFSDIHPWIEHYLSFLSQTEDSIHISHLGDKFRNRTGGSFADWFSWAGNEFSTITLESSSPDDSDQLIIIEISDVQKFYDAFNAFNETSDSLSFRETYAGYTLQNLNDNLLPQLLSGDVSQSDEEYFWYHDSSFLVLSNRVNAIKRLISDQATENTWNKSPRRSNFLERSVNPANLSIIVDIPNYQEEWINGLSPKWAEWAESQKTALQRLDKLALQFGAMSDEYYTSMVVTYQAEDQPSAEGFTTESRQTVDTLIASKPFVVRGGEQQMQVLVQDGSNTIHLLNPSQQTSVWTDTSFLPIQTEVFQLELPSSTRKAYCWASDTVLYMVNYLGTPVSGYPFYLPDSIRVQYLSVFDYEQNGDYRFLITDKLGRLWLFNADRDNLPGWNPLPLSFPLAEPPKHFRVRGKDCIIALQQDGLLHLLNRRGEPYSGFPVDLGQECKNPLFIKTGNSFADTEITTVTESGESISLNLLGKLTKREQLLRPTLQTHFMLCPDILEKTFVLARQDDQRLSILDQNEEEWFSQSYFTPGALARGELSVQYYNFSTDNQVIAISDKVQEFTYLFDQRGQLLNDRPIESRGEIALIYSETGNKYRLYRVYENELAVITF